MSFIKCITISANTVIPRSKLNPHSKPYWSREVNEAHTQERRMRNIWVRDGRPRRMHNIYFNYKRTKREFPKCQSLAFEQHIKKACIDIDNTTGCDSRLFWKLISRQQPRQSRVHLDIEYSGITAHTPQNAANVLATYFENICTPQKIVISIKSIYKTTLDYMTLSNLTSIPFKGMVTNVLIISL
jgi:hypothetical protein